MDTTTTLAGRYVAERVSTKTLARSTATNTRYVLTTYSASVPIEPALIRARHVTRWMGERDLAPSSLRNRLCVVRTFHRWLLAHSYTPTDVTVGVIGPKEPDRMPRALPVESVGALLHHCPDTRARLIVCLMVELGLRRGEVTRVMLGDIDRHRGLVLVHGKGGRERWLPLTLTTAQALNRYLAEHPATTGPLIRSKNDPRVGVSPECVGTLVTRWMRAAGVKVAGWDGVSAHSLRHTAASDVLDGGADVRQVQMMLGHSSLAVTQVYLRRPDGSKLRAVMEGRRYDLDHPVFHAAAPSETPQA